MEFLGFVISEGDGRPGPVNVKAISNFPIPGNVNRIFGLTISFVASLIGTFSTPY